MDNQFNHKEKLELYLLMIQKGFEVFQKPELLDGSIPGRDLNEIKSLIEAYKKNGNSYSLNVWIKNILNLRKHYKCEAFFNLMSDVMASKVESLNPNNPYREAYQFVSTILKGEFPDIENASEHTVMVILMLLQDLEKLTQTVSSEALVACLKSEENAPQESDQAGDEVTKRLMSLFKFRRIDQFINPLQISNSANEKVYETIFK